MYTITFLAVLAHLAAAQAPVPDLAKFTVNWAASYVQGAEYNISYTTTVDPISINLISGNYSQVVICKFEHLFIPASRALTFALAANDGTGSPYMWTVPELTPGIYQLELLDDDKQSDLSPEFQITSPALAPALCSDNGTTATPTTSMMMMPSTTSATGYTTTVWDDECTCQKQTTFAGEAEASAWASASASASAWASAGAGPAQAEAQATAAASASAGAGAEAAPSMAPVAASVSGPASNYTAAMITPTLATYTPNGANGASRTSGSIGVAAVLFAALLMV